MTGPLGFDPLVPRPLDRPTTVPLEPGADLTPLDGAKIFAAPDDPAQWPRWREVLHRWRAQARERAAYDDSLYRRDDLRWTRGCVVVSQVWLWDELLYDWDTGQFTPDRLLDDALARLGGFDGVVLWHAYPVIGVDERNQWDHYRLVPGLRGLVDRLHERGVRVFVDYNPWDVGTRRARSDIDELACLVAELDVDGVFLDTLKEGGDELLQRLREARTGVAVEGESTLPLARIADHPMSWAQWFADSPVPGVVRARWYEQRHRLHTVRRWHRDHSEEVQSAWLNGIGVFAWEVVFGAWVGWGARDAALLRRLALVHRRLPDLLAEGSWTPLVDLGPEAAAAGVHGSVFAGVEGELLALVNRSDADHRVAVDAWCGAGATDVWAGAPVTERVVTVPARGIGGVWRPADGRPAQWLDAQPISLPGNDFQHRRARRVRPARSLGSPPAEGTVVVPAGEHVLTVRYRCRETGMYQGAAFVDEWKPLPPRLHDFRTLQRVALLERPVAVATGEVTAAEFAAFVGATGHRPRIVAGEPPWWAGGTAPFGADGPAVEVDLEDARAYAAWRGARLPTEDEWQLAVSAGAGRVRPAVWNLTESEHSDGRSRFVMLKGGSDFTAEGSDWYFDGGVRAADHAAKYLVPGSGLARSRWIGFRIAWDLPEG